MTDGAKDVPVKTSVSGTGQIDIPIVVTLHRTTAKDIPIKVTLQGDSVKDVPIVTSLETYRVDYGMYGESIYETSPRQSIFYAQGGTPDKTIAVTDPYWFLKSGDTESGTEGFMELGIGQNTSFDESDANLTAFARITADGGAQFKVKPGIVLMPTTSAPPQIEGMLYYNDTTNKLNFWDGDSWESIDTGAGAPDPHGSGSHTGAIFAGANDSFGAFYLDIDDISVPADPAPTVRRLFVNTATGELSVRTSSSTTISLEGAGGGPGSGTQYTIPRWATTTTLGDSLLSEDSGGTELTVDGHVNLTQSELRFDDDDYEKITYISGTPNRGIRYTARGAASGWYGVHEFYTGYNGAAAVLAARFKDTNLETVGTMTIGSITSGASDYDVFLVSDSGEVKFRTGAEVLSDIGAAASSHNFDTHSGDVDLTDLAAGSQGSLIVRTGADWAEFALGTNTYVLKSGATDVAWGQVDYSELTGSQPAPINHNLIDTTGHPVSGLTGGHFLKALTTTTYGFAAHGLGASDVGAYTTAEVDTAIDTDITTHTSDDNAHHEVFESGDFTTAFAAEDFNNLATTAHVLASADHTVSGLTAGDILSADTTTTYSWKANPAATVPLALTDLASYVRGSIIYGSTSDWAALALGTSTYVLKSGATDVAWGQVDYSELTGSQPAPISHDLTGDHTENATGGAGNVIVADSATTFSWQQLDYTELASIPSTFDPDPHDLTSAYHTDSGLTTGHFLKATGTTTFAFGAHGLTASDVGAAATLSGTQWTLPVFDTTTTIGDSIASQDASATYMEIDGAVVTATGQWVAATGAPDGYIWAVSGDYPTYGIYYNSGTPDFLEFHWAAAIKTKFNMEDGAFECAAGDFNVDASGNITDITVAGASTDTDTFLVLDVAQVKSRTGAEVLSDIGAVASGHDFDTHSGDVDLVDIASYVQGSIIIGGGADWEPLIAGTEDYVLKMGATEPAWGTVDWSELTGTQPAPVAHVLDSASHTISGKTSGHFLKADSATTYSFQAHGLTASDVGAADALSGTQWTLPVFDTTTTLGDSMISQNSGGTLLTVSGAIQSITNLSMTTELDLTGAGAIIDLNPAHIVGANIIDITPSAAIGSSGQTWKAINIDMASLDPTLTASLFGIDIDLTGISMLNNPALWGIRVQLPGVYGSGVEQAILATGNARSVALCTDDYAIDVTGEVLLNTINAEASDVDKFLVDSSGVVKFRTGAEAYADMDGYTDTDAEAVVTAELVDGQSIDVAIDSLISTHATDDNAHHDEAHVLATTGPHSSALPLTDLASYVQGSIIIGGGADWEPLVAGTLNYVLKMGAAEPAWGQVDYSELSGSQPAPINHNLIDTTGHPVSGLTIGHFLKATGTTTYAFGAHGLTYSDVGAEAANANIQSHVASPVTDAHHTKFTGSEAVTAVVAENPLALTNALKIGANSIEDSTGAEMIGFDGAGYIDFLGGQGTPSDNDVLAWDIASSKWIVQAQVGAGGGVTGSGTQWTVPVWDDAGGTTIGDSMFTQDSGGTAGTVGGSLTVSTIAAEVTDVDKFLVSNAGLVKFRTGAEILSDIGAAAAAHDIVDHDTDATGAELTELTDSSETTLHSHASGAISYDTEIWLPWGDFYLTGTGYTRNTTYGWYSNASNVNFWTADAGIPIQAFGVDTDYVTIKTTYLNCYTSTNAGRGFIYWYMKTTGGNFALQHSFNPAAAGSGWRWLAFNHTDFVLASNEIWWLNLFYGSTSTSTFRAFGGVRIQYTVEI